MPVPENIATKEEAIDRILSINPVADISWSGSFGGEGPGRTKEEAGLVVPTVYNELGSDDGGTVTQVTITAAGPAVTGGDEYATANLPAVGTPWSGVLMVEGAETGDGRMFSPNSITWEDPMQVVMPLRRNIEDSHGGEPRTTAVLVGRINKVYRDPADPLRIMGEGVFDDNGTEGREALRLVREGFLKGVSVDPDSIKDADVELVFPESDGDEEDDMLMEMFAMPELTIFHAGRIRAATLVEIPAFVEAAISLGETQQAMVADAAHFAELSERPWNGAAHETRLAGGLDVRMARTAFAHVGATSVGRISTRFLHHEVNAQGQIGHANAAACIAGIRALNGGRAATLTDQERRAAYEHLAAHMRAAGATPPPYEGAQVILASSFDHLEKPPAEWFANPDLKEITPLTVTDDGRVYGHGAAWGTCHTAFEACVTPPSEGDHVYYRLGEVVTADGSRVAVGHITLGTGHAPVNGMSASRAAEHYDNTGTVVALVASGEDDHGIWVAGAIKPGTPDARVNELRAASLSGDWRRIGGKLRLVAFLAVNRPGFPVPRTAAFVSKKEQLSLVASGIVLQDARRVRRDEDGVNAALARIAKSIGRDHTSRMTELKNRVKGQ